MKIFVIPDCQIRPGDDTKFLRNIGRYVAEKEPDVIVNIGDFAVHGFCHHALLC